MTSDELRALADAATPGPWKIRGLPDEDGRINGMRLGPNGEDFIETDGGHYGPCYENAALIAALGPDAARLLADAMDYVAHMEKHWGGGIAGSGPLLARFAALRTETA